VILELALDGSATVAITVSPDDMATLPSTAERRVARQ
jgi:hypothetical protein